MTNSAMNFPINWFKGLLVLLLMVNMTGCAGTLRNMFWKRTGYENQDQDDRRKKQAGRVLQDEKTVQRNSAGPVDIEYKNSHRKGIYVDVVSGEPLFSSIDEIDSKIGLLIFTKPLEPANIIESTDNARDAKWIGVKSRQGGSRVGKVFKDNLGPGFLRYSINSTALRFIAKDDLKKEGFERYEKMFE